MDRQLYLLQKTGSFKNIALTRGPLSPPASGEVTVEVKAIGLNFADIFAILGLYSAAPKGSFVPGLEYAGVIIQIGPGVNDFQIGQRVMGVTRFGGYVTALNIDAKYVSAFPEEWTFEEAAAFPVQVLTAYYALVSLGNVQPGQLVLIQSAAGGVGLLANRIAKKIGAITIGCVGSEAKLPLLLKEGYDHFFVRDKTFKNKLKAILQGRELNLVLEASGGNFLKWSYELMASQGRMICYGSAVFTPKGTHPNYLVLLWKFLCRPMLDPLKMVTDNKSVMAFNLIWLYEKAGLLHQLLTEIAILNLPPPHISQVFQFQELPSALRTFQSGKTMGKIIVQV